MITDLMQPYPEGFVATPDVLKCWLVEGRAYASKTLVDHNAVCFEVKKRLAFSGAPFRVA